MSDFKLTGTYDYCVYHHPCLDGMAAWAVVHGCYPDTVGIPMNYGAPVPEVLAAGPAARVLFVDFSLPHDELKVLGEAHDVTVLDHHKTAQAACQKLLHDGVIKGVFDMDRSGARLAWDYCWPDAPPPPLISRVEDRDLWKFSLPHTKAYCAYLGQLPFDVEEWSTAMGQSNNPSVFADHVRMGRLVMEAETRLVRDMIKYQSRLVRYAIPKSADLHIPSHSRIPWPGDVVEVPALNCNYIHASEAGHMMFETYPDAPFTVTYYDSKAYRKVSLRSDNDRMDVSVLAKAEGGGGHRNAAGYTLPLPSLEPDGSERVFNDAGD